MNNQECKIIPEIVNVNSDKPTFYPYSVKISKCRGSCNNINNPNAKLCVADVFRNLNLKVFNLMSRTNETRKIRFHKNCKCKCRLNTNSCNNKEGGNEDKGKCECKELTDKGSCDKGFIQNPSNCEHEFDKLRHIGKYLEYKNSKCRKTLFDKLVEECAENVDEKEIYPGKLQSEETITLVCSSCTIYIMLFSSFFTIDIGIPTYFIYYKYINDDKKQLLKKALLLKQQFAEQNFSNI